jgi:hypothetical protein
MLLLPEYCVGWCLCEAFGLTVSSKARDGSSSEFGVAWACSTLEGASARRDINLAPLNLDYLRCLLPALHFPFPSSTSLLPSAHHRYMLLLHSDKTWGLFYHVSRTGFGRLSAWRLPTTLYSIPQRSNHQIPNPFASWIFPPSSAQWSTNTSRMI